MQSIGELSDKMWLLREEKRKHEAAMKLLEADISSIEARLLEAMSEQGVEMGRGQYATFSVQKTIVPQVENWDRFYEYIYRNHYFHLLQKRPAVQGCRELFEKNGAIPGVVPFTDVKIRLTTKSE